MSRRAYLAPVDRTPHTVSDKTVGALLPCTFVVEGASAFTQATAPGPNIRLLLNRDYYAGSADFFTTTNPLLTAYVNGDTAVAAILEPGQRYLIAAANATYTFGQEMTIGAAGRVAAAAQGNIVVGFCRQAGTPAAGDLIEVEIANFYAQP